MLKDSRFVVVFHPRLVVETSCTKKERERISSGERKIQAEILIRCFKQLRTALEKAGMHPTDIMDWKWTYAAASEDTKRRIEKVRAWQEKRHKKAQASREDRFAEEEA